MSDSRLCTIVIDCVDNDFNDCVNFWKAFLNTGGETQGEDQRYVELDAAFDQVKVLLQRVEEDPGIHLDVETTEQSAELDRARQLGARLKYPVKRWYVMEDPAGNTFCLCRAQ